MKLPVSYSVFSDAVLAEDLGYLFTTWQTSVFAGMGGIMVFYVVFSSRGAVIVFSLARPLLFWSFGW